MFNVLIVDDAVLFREGLHSLLAGEADFRVVGQASSVREAMDCIHELHPNLVLTDLQLEDGSGLDLLAALANNGCHPAPAVVLLTTKDQDGCLFEAIRHGAKGYLVKDTPFASLVAALRRLQHGELALSRVMASRLIELFRSNHAFPSSESGGLEALTTRELEVLRHVGTGASNQEIAERLVISEHTVKVHVHNILDKLKLTNRAQAAAFSRRYGLERSVISPYQPRI